MSTDLKLDHLQKNQIFENETKESKTFFQDSFRISYENSSKIFYSQETNCVDVKVNNYLCCQEGQNLYKITQIIYQDKIIRIEDRIQVLTDSPNMGQSCSFIQGKNELDGKNCSRTIQKVRIFNKNSNKDTKVQKKDKKNIVKNIVKLFLSWLQKKQSGRFDSHYEASLLELKKMMETENFNNRLIQKIIASKDVNKAFLQFVEDNAENEIKHSRIQDKQSHYEALQIYKNLLAKGQYNLGATSSFSEASEESQSPSGLNGSSRGQENSSSSQNSYGSSSKGRQAGIKLINGNDAKSNIIVVQNQMEI